MKTITAEAEARALALLEQGYLAGRVAEMVGISIAAVDRLAGRGPEVGNQYARPIVTVYKPLGHNTQSPFLDRARPVRDEAPPARQPQPPKKGGYSGSPTPIAKLPPMPSSPAPGMPFAKPASAAPDKPKDKPMLNTPLKTGELMCVIGPHTWIGPTRGNPPHRCPEHRQTRIATCAVGDHEFLHVSKSRSGQLPKYCVEHRPTFEALAAPAPVTSHGSSQVVAPLIIPISHKALRRRVKAARTELATFIDTPPPQGDLSGYSEKRWPSLSIRRQLMLRSTLETLELLLECMPEGDA